MEKPLYTHPYYSTGPTIHTPSPLSNPYIPYTTEMFSIFDGSNEDAYWWILSTESYFRATGKSEMAKMMVAALAMRGEALKWWLWWSDRHPQSDWDTFTTALLWHFKPEWRHLLPVLDEETEETCESSKLEVKPSRVSDCVVDLVLDIPGEHNQDLPPCSKLVEKPSITHDYVDSIAFITGEQDLDSPLKLEVQVVQLKIADSFDGVQQRSVIVMTGDKKFSNPALGPQSPKPLDTALAPPLPPPKPRDGSVAAGIDPLYAHVTLHKYSPPTKLSSGTAENLTNLISIVDLQPPHPTKIIGSVSITTSGVVSYPRTPVLTMIRISQFWGKSTTLQLLQNVQTYLISILPLKQLTPTS